jgi:tetratricopeptide (TPR) repeat protein
MGLPSIAGDRRGRSGTRPRTPAIRGSLLGLAACLLAAPASAREPAAAPAGLAVPSEESWGDEWFDEEAERAARLERQRILDAETERLARERAAAEAAARAAPAPEPVPREAPAILPPAVTFADLDRAWRERREALLRKDREAAARAEARLLEARLELDVPELHAFAAAAARESRAQEDVSTAEAVARGELAVALGPSLPGVHFQLARARFLHAPATVGGWFGPFADGVAVAATVPRWSRPILADVAAVALVGLLAAGAVVLLLLAARNARFFLHDFHHLFPRAATPAQTGALAALLVAAPAILGLGPFALAATVAAVAWPYGGRRERGIVGGFLALLATVPLLAGLLGGLVAWGPAAQGVWALERAGDFSSLPLLERRAESPEAEPEVVFAVARARKRQGDLAGAASLYERALAARPSWPEALVNLGNVRFLQGREDEALDLYGRAIALRPTLAAAYFDLSRLHLRRLAFGPEAEARKRALELDRSLLARFAPEPAGAARPGIAGEDGPLRANVFLLDAPLDPGAPAGTLSRRDRELLAAEVARRALGPIPAPLGPWAAAGVLGGLGLLGLLARRLGSSRPCDKCGRPACRRCDPEVGGGGLCGQCVHVFARRGAVDPAARVQKELSVRRRDERRRRARRALAYVLAGQVASGRVVRGAALLAVAAALLVVLLDPAGPVRPGEGGPPTVFRPILAAPLLVAVWILGVRDALREEE